MAAQPTLAVALIVKNAAQHLKACLETVCEWVDEIIIVDSGSSDETESIARQFTSHFYVNAQWPGFGPQRQLAQTYVQSDFVLWLDADERVTPLLKQSILHAIAHHQDQQIYRLNRLNIAFGKAIYHSGWHPDWIIRLYKTQDTHYSDALVHESVLVPKGFRTISLQGKLQHFTFASLDQYHQKTQLYMKSWADQREGNKQSSIAGAMLHSLFRFLKMYVLKLGFLDGQHGLLLALLSAHTTFSRYADLWLRAHIKTQVIPPAPLSKTASNHNHHENLSR
jgi:(heptosyl)LPS beta-1,4-glucosyltransferase